MLPDRIELPLFLCKRSLLPLQQGSVFAANCTLPLAGKSSGGFFLPFCRPRQESPTGSTNSIGSMQETYDIIGDVHGCADALRRLCDALGYDESYYRGDGRRLVFLGDLIDRGPDSLGILRLVGGLVSRGRALLTLGNHDDALLRWLCGETFDTSKGGLSETIAQIEARRDKKTLKKAIAALYERAPLYLVLDGGALIVAHAGIEEEMIGKTDPETRHFVLNGDAIGKSPEGKTLRRDWAAEYRGTAFIVYGHTPQECAEVRGNTVNIDTGAYRGGKLTAFRWPERILVSVPSRFRLKE